MAQLLAEKRGKRNPKGLPRLTIKQILIWIDAHYWRKKTPPRSHTGLIVGTQHEKWRNIDNALRYGLRGLKGGLSLAQLISKQRPRYL